MWRRLQDMTAGVRTDQATGAGETHHRNTYDRARQIRYRLLGITDEQPFNSDRAKYIDTGSSGVEVINRRDLHIGVAGRQRLYTMRWRSLKNREGIPSVRPSYLEFANGGGVRANADVNRS